MKISLPFIILLKVFDIQNILIFFQVSRMSILACLGGEAEAIRDMYLTRLQAVTEVCNSIQ